MAIGKRQGSAVLLVVFALLPALVAPQHDLRHDRGDGVERTLPCPELKRNESLVSRGDGSGLERNVVLVNTGVSALYIYWVDFDGVEVKMAEAPAHHNYDMLLNSFVGHGWRVYDERGSLAAEREVPERSAEDPITWHVYGCQPGTDHVPVKSLNYADDFLRNSRQPCLKPEGDELQCDVRTSSSVAPLHPADTAMLAPGKQKFDFVAAFANTGCESLAEWISRSGPVEGYHVLCLLPGWLHLADGGKRPILHITAFRRGVALIEEAHVPYLVDDDAEGEARRPDPAKLRRHVEALTRLSRTDAWRAELLSRRRLLGYSERDTTLPPPWQMFTTDGKALGAKALAAMLPHDSAPRVGGNAAGKGGVGGVGGGLAIVFEGGSWVWPGIELGFQRRVKAGDRTTILHTVGLRPLVYLAGGLLDKEVGGALVPSTKPFSEAVQYGTERAALDPSNEEVVSQYERRMAKLARLPRSQMDKQSCLARLTRSEGLTSAPRSELVPQHHVDAVGADKGLAGHRNRLLTAVTYLAPGGGHHGWPDALDAMYLESTDTPIGCAANFKIRPGLGETLLMYNMLPDGSADLLSNTTICLPTDPKARGTFMIMNRWWNSARPGYKKKGK